MTHKIILLGNTILGIHEESMAIGAFRGSLNNILKLKPGERFHIRYELIIQDDSIRVKPENSFTALRLASYKFPPNTEKPFTVWKNFVIIYDKNMTGFFLV